MNLRAEMARRGIRGKDLAILLGVRYSTVYDKLNGKYSFSFDEALAIKKAYFPEHNLEYLFDNEDQSRKVESEVM